MDDFDGLALFRKSLEAKTPEPGPSLNPEQLAFARRAFPKGYADMLGAFGFGFYANRRFQFLDSGPFAQLVERLFAGDPQIDPSQTFITGCDAFGAVTLWSQKHFAMQLDIHNMHLTCADLTPAEEVPFIPPHLKKTPNPAAKTDPNNRARSLLPFEPQEADFWDAMNKPLFAKAKETLGSLEAGEIYGFDPPLAATGGAIPRDPFERMVRCSAQEALDAAATASPMRLVKRVRGKLTEVREIGPV